MPQRIDKEELAKRIRELEGLNNDEKSTLLELLNSSKKYGLVWEEKVENTEEALRDNLPVLAEDKTLALTNGGEDAPNHILIEGDNLEALTTLSYTHEDKIDVIYIDPPYNTGKKDFVYNDSFVDSEDSYRHSKWLSFMSKRLRIAKHLLSDRGVIFISIDDNEQANLKLLCDEVFGEDNSIGPFIQNKQNAKNDTLNVQKNHEFIFCYRKRVIIDDKSSEVRPNIVVKKTVKKEVLCENGEFYYLNDAITTRGDGGTLNARPNLGYSFYYNPKTNDLIPAVDYDVDLARNSNDESQIYTNREDLIKDGYVIIRPPLVRGKLGCWTWDINKAKKDSNLLFVKQTRNRFNIHKRTFVPNNKVFESEGAFFYNEETFSNSRSILDYSTNDGTNAFKDIMGNETPFNNPKNLDMIAYLMAISSTTESVILDFFAGSGTTLHAVMQLNKEDGGKRQCILVTNNENNICRDVTYERNKRVINGYTTPKGQEVEGLKQNNLRYYRTHLLPRQRTNRNMRHLVSASTDLLCIKENIFKELKIENLKLKIRLTQKDFRVFMDGERAMMVIYNEEVIPDIVEWLQSASANSQLSTLNTQLKTYVFSPGPYAWDDDFAPVIDRVDLCALPEAIYQAYKSVLPKKKVRQNTAEGSIADTDREII